ncbi:hypothetical protein CYY_005942 [Polysphondylium violaceum]|uniref:RhoGAP domain-containing protein n=1 Tax=Polysphondylium violaceum TaxID=133409 RepID=A0A8J4PUB0_9MYCE|nr:hypothetical protein CYY_005942 [Polysphondylium violaceum]
MDQQKKYKFSENLWDGFDLLVKRTENDLTQSKNVLSFFKKKAELEEQHSKKLEKLASKMLMTIDDNSCQTSPSFYSSWRKIVNTSMAESDQHTLLNTNILNKVIQPFQAMIKDFELKRKKIVSEGIKLRHDMKEMVDALRKSQLKYEKSNKDLEMARMELKDFKEQMSSSDSDLNNVAKLERKVQKFEMEVSNADDEYREQIKATNDFQHLYNYEAMPKILNDFEHFILSSHHLSKSYFSAWTTICCDIPPIEASTFEAMKRSVDQIDNANDIQEFIKRNITKKQLYVPFQYEPYIEGKLSKKATSTWNTKLLSQFSRSSSANTSSGNVAHTPAVPKQEVILPTASFKVPLEELLNRQKDTHPQLEVPYVLLVLAEKITKLKGHVTEGIFRVPGIISTIMSIKLRIDQGNFDLSDIDDVRTPAALLKLWLRDIPEPLIPVPLYQSAVDAPTNAIELVKKIPAINQKVLTYLIHFIQIFCKLEFVAHSKMGVSNLSMIFAPTILRCPSSDPNVLLNNVNNERAFVENLIKGTEPNPNEFLGLPVNMIDAIQEQGEIEELGNDEDDDEDDDDEVHKITKNSTTATPTTTTTTLVSKPSRSGSSGLNTPEPEIIAMTQKVENLIIENNNLNNSSDSNSSLNINNNNSNNNNNGENESTQSPNKASSLSSSPVPMDSSNNTGSPNQSSPVSGVNTARPFRTPTQSLGWVRVTKPAAKSTR